MAMTTTDTNCVWSFLAEVEDRSEVQETEGAPGTEAADTAVVVEVEGTLPEDHNIGSKSLVRMWHHYTIYFYCGTLRVEFYRTATNRQLARLKRSHEGSW